MATILRRGMSAAPGVTVRLVSRPRDSEFVVHKRVYQQEVKLLRTQWRAELLQKKQQEEDAKRGNVVFHKRDKVDYQMIHHGLLVCLYLPSES